VKRLLTLSLAALLGVAGISHATGYYRSAFFAAPVISPVVAVQAYAAPVAVCGAAYSAPVAPLVVPIIALVQGVAQV
jgi:hypothetical protein